MECINCDAQLKPQERNQPMLTAGGIYCDRCASESRIHKQRIADAPSVPRNNYAATTERMGKAARGKA